MQRLEYFLVSESVSIDEVGGTVSIFHIRHHKTLELAPARIPSLWAVAAWIDDGNTQSENEDEGHVKLEVVSPGGDPVNTFRRTINSPHRVEQSLFRVLNIPIVKQGDLLFKLYLNDECVATHTVGIKIIEQLDNDEEDLEKIPR